MSRIKYKLLPVMKGKFKSYYEYEKTFHQMDGAEREARRRLDEKF